MTAENAGSTRGAILAARLAESVEELIATFETVDPEVWIAVPAAGVWSIGKDAAHVAEATVMHQWIVRRTIGEPVTSRRPPIERAELTTSLSPPQMAALVRQRTLDGVALLSGLSEAQLARPTRPPRARGELLARTIERVLIGHVDTHRAEIEAKLRRLASSR
jgi:uncharacterized damage-inducible protein DinB